ncbi:LysM peptidoglycan-binding domain-containing protein [Candidatus Leptofilum sp.]|uniref:LysM peptidoglycan-binding domain-containing protein n=1 Tax=Candidatus Leptofilum sp. TaxID=3241576 RepID=UPI003B592AD5
MVSQRRLLNLITMLILLMLIAVACERPLGGTEDPGDGDQAGEVTDVNQGGGTDGDTTAPADDASNSGEVAQGDNTAEESGGEENADNTAGETGDEAPADDEEAGGSAGDASGGEQAGDAAEGEENPAEDNADDSNADDGNTAEDGNNSDANEDDNTDAGADNDADNNQDNADDTIPATHTVAAGENLYRIGLKYGISWVAIANENNLANPNVLTVGQVLKLPGASEPDPGPTPTPSPQTETTYIVQPGDNLFRIGLKFGISWVQIAEANGLVNPNLIKAGDELKIPVDAPGPAPAFSHVVKQGETLFLISLQYGVAWPTIAEANDLTSPYVIYVGQTLEIPGSQ